MGYKLYIFDRDNYASVNAAKADGALVELEGFPIPDDHGLWGGMACDMVEIMQTALRMVGQQDRLAVALFDKTGNFIDCRM
jgi:hypothetical protein